MLSIFVGSYGSGAPWGNQKNDSKEFFIVKKYLNS